MSAEKRIRQWLGMVEDLEGLAQVLRDQGPDVLERGSISNRWDGFPSSSGGAGVGGGGADPFDRVARQADWDLGLHDPDDPPPVDSIADAAHAMRAEILEALRHLREAVRAIDRARPKLPLPPAAHEAAGCVNCARWEVFSVAVKAGRCFACYGYRARHPQRFDAPSHLVLARPENATRRSLATREESA